MQEIPRFIPDLYGNGCPRSLMESRDETFSITGAVHKC